MPQSYWFKAVINLTRLDTIQMHIHPPMAEIGMNYQYWMTPVYTKFLDSKIEFTEYRLTPTAVKKKNAEDDPCVEDPEYNRHTCVKKVTSDWYITMVKQVHVEPGCENITEGMVSFRL